MKAITTKCKNANKCKSSESSDSIIIINNDSNDNGDDKSIDNEEQSNKKHKLSKADLVCSVKEADKATVVILNLLITSSEQTRKEAKE